MSRAIAERETARKLDPVSPLLTTALGEAYHHNRQFDLAIRMAQKALELDPTYPVSMINFARAIQTSWHAPAGGRYLPKLLGFAPTILGCCPCWRVSMRFRATRPRLERSRPSLRRCAASGTSLRSNTGGVLLSGGGFLNAGPNLVVSNSQGHGIFVINNSRADLDGSSITGSHHGGLVVVNQSSGSVGPAHPPTVIGGTPPIFSAIRDRSLLEVRTSATPRTCSVPTCCPATPCPSVASFMGDGKQKVALLQLGPKFHLPRGAKPTVGTEWLGMFPNCGNGSWQSIVDHVSVVIRIFTAGLRISREPGSPQPRRKQGNIAQPNLKVISIEKKLFAAKLPRKLPSRAWPP